MTISLWESYEDVRTVGTRAKQLRGQAAQSIGVATPVVDIYQVEIAV